MRGRAPWLLVVALLVGWLPPMAGAQDLLVEHRTTVFMGGAFSVGVYGAHGAESAQLISPAGVPVCRARGIRLDTRRDLTVFFLGVPSTASPGEHEIRLLDGNGEVLTRSAVLVAPRPFKTEEIPLNQALSSLRAEPNERRFREGLLLMEVLGTTRPNAVYQHAAFVKPMDEWIQTSWYGDRRIYRYSDGARVNALHNGIDLAGPVGAPVYAAGPGEVVIADNWVISGYTVILEHLPGVYSLYYHLDSLSVTQGAYVDAGAVIGTVGATGLATGPHLHWEVRVSKVPVEPDALRRSWLLDNLGWFDTLSLLTP